LAWYVYHPALKDSKDKGWEMSFQLTKMGSCHSPQARCRVGRERLSANRQQGFADGRRMVRLRKICCKPGSVTCFLPVICKILTPF